MKWPTGAYSEHHAIGTGSDTEYHLVDILPCMRTASECGSVELAFAGGADEEFAHARTEGGRESV